MIIDTKETKNMKSTNIIVIGGGIIGVSIAYGLVEKGEKVMVLDNGMGMNNASRGNFGLVWVQGKGAGMPRYTKWTIEAAQKWPIFSEKLGEETGFVIDYEKHGGFEVCLGEKAWSQRKFELEQLQKEYSFGKYDFQMLDRKSVQNLIPEMLLGEAVTGASFSPHDSQLNPLKLLTALISALVKKGVTINSDQQVESISYRNKVFEIKTSSEIFSANKVVLACGLGIKKLAQQVGLNIPIRPQRGQILVTEKTKPLLKYPFVTLRQTREGSFMIGASHEDVGFDTGTTLLQMRSLAGHAVQIFPELSKLQLVRCWGALRILTPDTKPIYVESEICPGAFVVTSHSGITLAPLHANILSKWILDGTTPEGFEQFHSKRFNA